MTSPVDSAELAAGLRAPLDPAVASGDPSVSEVMGLLQRDGESEGASPGGRGEAIWRRTVVGASCLAVAALLATAAGRPSPAPRIGILEGSPFEVKSQASNRRYQCLDSYVLSDFSSKGNMELAGWSFNWDDEFVFKPPIYQMYAPGTAYWGCSKAGGGTISLTLQGEGVLTLDFGNSWGNDTSSVTAFLNGVRKSVAGPYTFSKTVKISFQDGDTLDIVEGPSGVIVINSITFRCATTTTFTATTTTAKSTATTTTTSVTTVNLLSTKGADTTTTVPTTSTVTTTKTSTTSKWKDIEEAKRKWQVEYAELQKKRLEERKKKEQLEHQLELERAVLEQIRSEREKLKKATEEEREALKKAKEERAKAKKEKENADKEGEGEKGGGKGSGKGKDKPSDLSTNDTNGTNASAANISKRSKEERKNVTDETKLAEAVERQKKHTREELAKLEKDREKEQAEEEAMAKNLQGELEKSNPKKEDKHEDEDDDDKSKDKKKLPMPSLYCYSLMLPFGYEPDLLKAQKDKGVGIFACDEWAVFSNSTVLLDTGMPSPVEVSLLRFSLAVPYGGKWHTALNTDVFNGVWTEIVRLGNYRMHDWVVKADPDSVLFPNRLVQLLSLRRPMNQVMNRVSERRLMMDTATGRRLEWRVPKNASCGDCKMPGFEGQSCNSHVQYIQKQGHSCSEALRRVSREPPTDCGCDCNRIESCDFKMDPKMYRNYQVIQGKSHPGAMYINNCKFGLHGPIEVLSQRAVTTYVEGLPRCSNLLVHPWGEDKFMDRCMLELGVMRVNQFGLLNEIACGQTPAPCGDANVAFHPFKTKHSYFACWEYANRYGHGPADPEFADVNDPGYVV